DSSHPTAVESLPAAQRLALGDFHSCALASNKTVWCWGDNSQGQLGDGSRISRAKPQAVGGLEGIVQLVAGPGPTCTLSQDGATFCWGANANGELGIGSQRDSATPERISGLDDVIEIATGGYTDPSFWGNPPTFVATTCAVRKDGAIWCWGARFAGGDV